MIDVPLSTLAARATKLARLLCDELELNARVTEAQSFVGGGSAPLHPLETVLVAVSAPFPAPYHSEAGWRRPCGKAKLPSSRACRRERCSSTCGRSP